MDNTNEVKLYNTQNSIREQEGELQKAEKELEAHHEELRKNDVKLHEHDNMVSKLRRIKRQGMQKTGDFEQNIKNVKKKIDDLKKQERIIEHDIRQEIVGKTIK